MLGLLLMAGLGFAATAIMEHVDVHSSDEPHSDDDETPAAASHGSLLDHQDAAHHDDASAHERPTGQHDGGQNNHDHGAHHARADDRASGVKGAADKVSDVAADHPTSTASTAAPASGAATGKVFGTEQNDTLQGSAQNDLMEGNGGDDLLLGKLGKDNLIAFDQGKDTLLGNRGDDTLHGYLVQHNPDDTSFVIEDHQADHLDGGFGNDKLLLGSDDVGTGGQGADEFHVSWDVDHGHPATITDYNPKQDKLFVEFTSNHADEGLTAFKTEETSLTTEPMKDGSGTSILLNGEPIAHVLGATNLKAADIGLIQA